MLLIESRRDANYDDSASRGQFAPLLQNPSSAAFVKEPSPKDPLQAEHCAEVLKALSEPIRLRIIDAHRGGPSAVGDLATAVEEAVVTVSHHLGILRNAGLVQRKRKGRFIVYSLKDGVLEPKSGSNRNDHINLGCCRLELPKA